MGSGSRDSSKKVSAVTFVLLMLTMSFSASMQAWDFFGEPAAVDRSTVSNGSTVTLVQGFFGTIPTNVSGGSGSGTYWSDADGSALTFTSESIDTRHTGLALGSHTCMVLENGLNCWGSNYYGQLGLGHNNSVQAPTLVPIPGSNLPVEVATGTRFTCALMQNGDVYCWGYNDYGQLGIGTTVWGANTPQAVDLGTGRAATTITASQGHACAVLDNGAVKCWGRNDYGQLGIGSSTSSFSSPQSVYLGSGRTAVEISAGELSTCAVLDDGSIKCWGYNAQGQLGIGSTTNSNTPAAVTLPNGSGATDVSVGSNHACALHDDGNLSCWGLNYYGELGLGNNSNQLAPVQVSFTNGAIITQISAGLYYTCAVTNTSSVFCWGRNADAQLGIGTFSNKNSPQLLPSPPHTEMVAVYTGASMACAVSTEGKVYCWGLFSLEFNLGLSTYAAPVQVPVERHTSTAAQSSGGLHTCSISDIGELRCWGDNDYGQLGTGTASGIANPVMIDLGLGRTASNVSSGMYYSCAVLDNGLLKCWGLNNYGQLGINSTVNQGTPQTVIFNSNQSVVDVSAWSTSTCAMLSDGSLSCWGRNNFGQLGVGSYTGYTTPQSVNLGSGRTAVNVSVGENHACAVLDDGTLKCWGRNNWGELGTGSTSGADGNPELVSLGSGRTAVDVAAGGGHTCAVLDNGVVKCWGYNGYGQLGIGSTTNYNTPQSVNLGTGRTALSVSAGTYHTCAVLDNGALKCWGSNGQGQLGIGSYTGKNSPEAVSFSTGVSTVKVSAGQSHTCAVLTNSPPMCWGANGDRQLGSNGTANMYSSPKEVFSYRGAAMVYPSFHVEGDAWYGTPTSNGSFDLVVHHNTSTSSSHTVTVNVVKPFTYSQTTLALTKNQSMSALTPTLQGGPYAFTVSPSLPSGLLLDPHNGTITGTVQSGYPSQNYTISASNYSGSFATNLTISVVDLPPVVNLTTTQQTLMQGFRPSSIDLSSTGGELTSSTVQPALDGISPALGDGGRTVFSDDERLCFSTSTGVWCVDDGGFERISTAPQDDLTFVNGKACLVGMNGLACENTTIANQFSSLDLAYAFDAGGSERNLCVLTRFDDLKCAGNDYAAPTTLNSAIGVFSSLDSNDDVVCGLTVNGTVHCWGDASGPLGQTNPSTTTTPLVVNLGTGVEASDLAVGGHHACAITTSGDGACWGVGTGGQLGYGYASDSSYPREVDVPGWVEFTSISAGGEHTCAMNSLDGVMCWGNNQFGQLGDGTTTNRTTPVNVTNIPSWMNVVEVHAVYDGTCVVDDTGGVWCWGNNANGKLGLNASINIATTPSPVRFPVSSALRMTSNENPHLFGAPLVNQSATTHRWYANNSGGSDDVNISISVGVAAVYSQHVFNLTRNTSTVNVQPTVTGGPYQFSIIPGLPAGMSFGASNGTIWGMPSQVHARTNHTIFVENNSGYDQVKIVLQVHDIPPTIVYPSSSYSLVRNWTMEPIIPSHQDGEVERVGVNATLPDGVEHLPLANVQGSVSAGTYHTCSITSGNLKCWGAGEYGRLGLGSSTNQLIPQSVSLGTERTAVSVAAGNAHTCAVLDDGSLKCWGRGSKGQLGTGSTTNYNTPQLVSLGTGRTAVSVSAGGEHTCAVLDDGSLKCWGRGLHGRLGIGSNTDQYTPQSVSLGMGRTAVSVSAGPQHTCAVLDDGSLKCWGYNYYGQLGIGSNTDQYTPQSVSLGMGRTAVSVAVGMYHTCAVLDDNSLKCWGKGGTGQLGIGSTQDHNTPQSVSFGTGRTAVSVSVGYYFTCAVTDDGSIMCWGENSFGQLGINSTTNQYTPQSVSLGTGRTAASVSAGYGSTCAVIDDGSLMCWGRNNNGQLGINSTTNQNTPTQIPGLTAPPAYAGSIYGRPTSVTAGANYLFTANNTYGSSNDTVWIEVVPAYNYGNNTLVLTRNQSFSRSPVLTGGPYNASFSPVLPPGLSFNATNGTIWGAPTNLSNVTQFLMSVSNSTGSDTITLSIYIDDIPPTINYTETNLTLIRGWEIDPIVPSLEDGTAERVEVSPYLPLGLDVARQVGLDGQVSLGDGYSCAIKSGDLFCWGYYYQTGHGQTTNVLEPTKLNNLGAGRFAMKIATNQYTACVILDNGELKCWGRNFYGTVGTGAWEDTPATVNLGVGRKAVDVATGKFATCAVLDDGSVKCWGSYTSSVLGPINQPNSYYYYPIPVNMSVGRSARTIGVGNYHACAILDNGSVNCWGRNDGGKLGIGANTSIFRSPQFVDLGVGRTALEIDVKDYITCALLDDYTIKCWGPTSGSNTPRLISMGAGYTALSLSSLGCYVRSDNNLTCWNSSSNTSSVVSMPNGLGVKSAANAAHGGTNNHRCVILSDGSFACWGGNDMGQLGIGNTTSMSTPTLVDGFNFTQNSLGVITGSARKTTVWATYTFTANNTYGSSNDTISIEVLPAYDYGNETLWLTRNQTMTARSPIITGGPYTVTIWPPVPSGMFWNASNGTFWGTPSMNQTWTEYYINVSNSTGSDTIIVNIGIGDIVPLVTYTNTTLTYIRGFEIDDVLPTHLGGHIGTVETYPALPEGLSIADPSTWTSARPNGTLYGLPTQLAGTTTYEIWFNNSIGSYLVNLTITVLPAYDYGNGTVSLTRNETMTPRAPIITGGPYTTVLLNGTLPPGMFFNPSNGTLWGTPSIVVATTMYTVYIANADGEDEVTFNITVAEIPPILDYNLAFISYRRGFLSEHPYPILTGGEVATFEISSALPSGMSFNGSNGYLSGVPMVAMNATAYTVWANNSLGSSSWNLTIEVLPGITHATTSLVFTRNATVQPYEPTINIVERNLSIDPPLPPGLFFDVTNATISGASLIPWPTLEHRIRLWNATGEDWLNITVTAHEILPYVVYSTNASLSLNAYGLDPLVPLGSGGTPVNWSADFDGLEGLALLRAETGRTLDGEGNTLCAITADERVICWGANDMGQLGQGNTNPQSNPVAVTLASASLPVELAVGETHTCVVLANGAIDCWGQNDQGQLGLNFSCVYGSFSSGCNGNFAVPQANTVISPSIQNFTQVTVGQSHTCALLEDGQALCWGDNTYGQLGDNEVSGSTLAMPVNTSLRFISLSAGTAHTCGVAMEGSLWCWGRNSFGQLGDSTTQDRFLPAEVLMPQGYTARSVSSGGEHTCAVLNGSQPACWGRNSQGQLGDGTVLGKITPRIVTAPSLGAVTTVVAGPAQTCVLESDQSVWCWGASGSSAFLNTSGSSLIPVEVQRLNGMSERQVAVGESHVCTVNARYDLMCRGSNQYGQLPGHAGPSSSTFVEWKDRMLAIPHHPAGTVYGAPVNGSGMYLITLNVSNIIGTHTFNHSVEVGDAFQFPTSLVEMVRNRATAPISPTLASYATGQFTITPALPPGLTLNSTTGALTGTPMSNMSQQTFVLVHANSHGFNSTAFNLVIYEPAADVVYPGSTINLTRGESTLSWVPTVSNGTVETWSIVPALPAGLTFANGVLAGTPTVNWTTTNYRIYANNTGGVTFVDLSLTVVEPLPDLILGLTDIVGVRGEALGRTTVSNTGGKVATWSIVPALPDGLVFADGVLSGTPLVNSSAVVYTVRATNSGGTASLTFTLTVHEPTPMLHLDPVQFSQVRGETISSIIILNGGGLVANWTISPALPDGLVFEAGRISGTPRVNATLQTFTVTASNTGGSDSVQFTMVVVEPVPSFSYGSTSFVLSRNTPFEAIAPTSLGGAIASWSISPSLPSGMFFDDRRGIIQGLAVSTSPEIEYTVTASNSGGETLGYFTLQVRNPAPVFSLPNDEIGVVEGKAMTRFAPFVSSDVVVNTWSYAVDGEGALPSGLFFDQTTGAFSGTPSDGAMTLRIVLTAINDGGNHSAGFNLSVLEDFDGDGIADIDDEDDDNDGYSDIEELTRNSDPRDASSTPIEGFEIIIPGTEISLGAWDIIGMLTGIPLIIWLSFSLVTRNKRTQRFVADMRLAKTRQELDAVAERYEKAIMWKLIGPHQGMRLERIRAEADDSIEERERAFKYKMEENILEEEKTGAELEAEFFDEVDQTPLVEKAEKAEAGEPTADVADDKDETDNGGQKGGSTSGEPNDGPSSDDLPSSSTPATSVDDKGYEWFVPDEGGVSYYRVAGTADEWVKFEN